MRKVWLMVGAGAIVVLAGCSSSAVEDTANNAASAAASAAASSVASAASSAAGAVNAAACETLAGMKSSMAVQNDDKATVGDVRKAIESNQQQLAKVSEEAGPVQSAIVAGVTAAENSYLDSLSSYPADTKLADTTAAAQAAGAAAETAYNSLVTSLNCPK